MTHTVRAGRTVRARLVAAALTLVAAGCDDPVAPTVAVEAGCQPVSSWTYPVTKVAQTSLTVFVVHNDQPVTAPIAMTVDGPDAAAFTVTEPAFSTCLGATALAAGDVCIVRLGFTPTEARDHHATLHLGATAIPLTGVGGPAGGLTARIRNLDVVSGGLGSPDWIETLIVNDGPTAVDLTGITGVGDDLAFAISGSCGRGALAPGAACDVRLAAVQRWHGGCVAGAFTVGSSVGPLTVPVTSRFLPALEVSIAGAGTGRVVSSPPGIDCGRDGGRCAKVFLDGGEVTLTATATDGGHFNGWGYATFVQGTPTCQANAATCRLPPMVVDDAGDVGALAIARAGASFASAEAKAISLTFAGAGAGRVTGALDCTSSCRGWVEPGVDARLDALTPSRFGGWGGACTGDQPRCQLGPVVNDRDVTVTFAKDERELTTVLIERAVVAGAFATDGDLLALTADQRLTRLGVDGATRWRTDVVTRDGAPVLAAWVRSRASDAIYALVAGTPAVLVKLDADGTVAWRRDTGAVSHDPGTPLAVLADGRVAVASVAEDKVRIWTAAGALDRTLVVAGPQGVAEAPVGTLVVASGVAPSLRRFDAAGAELPSWPVASERDQLAVDPAGRLTLYGRLGLRRLDAAGAVALTSALATDATARGLGAAASGQVLAVSTVSPPFARTVMPRLETFDATARTWSLDKPTYDTEAWAVWPGGATCDDAGRCAVFGYLSRQHRAWTGWIALFTVP